MPSIVGKGEKNKDLTLKGAYTQGDMDKNTNHDNTRRPAWDQNQ